MALLDKMINRQLRADETVVIILRRFPLAFWKSIVLIAALLLSPGIFFFPLLGYGHVGILVLIALWVLGFVWLGRTLLLWALDSVVLTNRRIIDIDQRGLLFREVSECSLEAVQDIRTLKKGVGAHVFDYGTIKVQTSSRNEHFELTHVRHPQQMQELIFSIQQEHISKMNHGTQEERTPLI